MNCTQYYKIHNTEYKTIFIQNTECIYKRYAFYSRRYTILHARIPGTVEIH